MIKKRLDYGLVLTARLKDSGEFIDAKKIARECNFSPVFMEKVAQELRSAGFLKSRKGMGGGYMLAKNITTVEIIYFFERQFSACPLMRNNKP